VCSSDLRRWWRDESLLSQLRNDLKTLHELTHARGQRLLFVIFPYRFEVVGQETEALGQFRRMLQEIGVSYLDLYPSFVTAQHMEELYSFRDDVHPNARGHELVAKQLLPEVKRGFTEN